MGHENDDDGSPSKTIQGYHSTYASSLNHTPRGAGSTVRALGLI